MYGTLFLRQKEDVALNSANLDSGAFQVGKDYYIYCCDKGSKQDEEYKISLNSTYPVGYNAENQEKSVDFTMGIAEE